MHKFGVEGVFNIDLPGVVIWQHVHQSTLHLFREEGWLQLPKGFLDLKILECRNSSDISGMRPGSSHDTLSSQSFVNPDWIPPGTYSLDWIPPGTYSLSTFPVFIIIHLDQSISSNSFLLHRKRAPFCCEKCQEVITA